MRNSVRWNGLPVALAVVTAMGSISILSCGDGVTEPSRQSDPDSLKVFLSEPVSAGPLGARELGAGSWGDGQELNSSAPLEMSFLSYPPGSIPDGDSIEVFNRASGALVGAAVNDGGVDPFPVPASVADTLLITIFREGVEIESGMAVVPRGIPPRVLRTRPRRAQTRVPLNSSMKIVFTDPVSPESLNPETVQLLDNGQPVPVTFTRSWDGLSLELTPTLPLRHGATYQLRIEPAVDDRSGDRLEEPFTSEFRTISVAAQLVGGMVFESKRDGGLSEIWMMRQDGTDVSRLTNRVGGGTATGPSLSPDGRRVAFSVWPAEGDWDIYVINVDGTGLRNLTDHPGFDGWRPAWSPDGTRLSFFSTRDDPANDEIYVMNSDGSDVIRLTDHPADDAHSTWSPDGSRIAFETNRRGNFDIYVMNSDGTAPTPLTDHPADDGWPAWSPDGTRIAFESWRDGNREIYVMDADGSNVLRLTHFDGFDSAPAWSWDGTRIAFSSDRGGSTDLWVMNSDGSGLERLTDHRSADFFPSWSR